MKKILSIALILMMLTGVFAETAVPTLISELPFEVTQKGDEFTIILDGNMSTGYDWTYVIDKNDHVEFISSDYKTSGDLPGAPGKHYYSFRVLKDGVSTIKFDHSQAFNPDSSVKVIDILVYKNGDKVFVEENQIVTIANDLVPELYVEDNKTIEVGGVTMVVLADTLRDLGFEVKWIEASKSVELSKGAKWTSITIGENAYFKNRMAARPLSAAPIIKDGKTYVPAEFFSVILDLGLDIEEGNITFNEYQMGSYTGYIKDININDKGTVSLSIVYDLESDMADVIVHTSPDMTFVQGNVKEGDMVSIVSSMVTTMSLPPQTAGYIIY